MFTDKSKKILELQVGFRLIITIMSQNESLHIIRELKIQDVLKDESQRTRLIRILMQTLNNFGLKDAAHTLEKQSKIEFFDEQLQRLEEGLKEPRLLNETDQELLNQLLKNRDRKTKEKAKLAFLELLLGRMAEADKKPEQETPSQEESSSNQQCEELDVEQSKSAKLEQRMLAAIKRYIEMEQCSEQTNVKLANLVSNLIFSPKLTHKLDNDSLVRQVIELSDKSGIQKKSMQKIIAFYIESKVAQQGDPTQLYEFSLTEQINAPTNLLPRKMLKGPLYQTKLPITMLTMNMLGNKVLTIGVNTPLKQSQLILWLLDKVDLQGKQLQISIQNPPAYIVAQPLKQQVQSACWNFQIREQELIATASRSSITLFNGSLKKLITLPVVDALCCRFNPITNFLYTSGLNNHQLRVWSSRGEQLDTFRIGPQRQITFSQDGIFMYLVSAIESKLTKMETVEVEKVNELKVSNFILDCQPVDRDFVLLSTKDQLMILKQSNLQVLRVIDLQMADSDVVYYTYVRLLGPWFIASDGNHLKAIHSTSGKTCRWNCHSILPAFDVSVNPNSKIQMVTTNNKRLNIWVSGLQTIVVDEQDELSEESNREQPDEQSNWCVSSPEDNDSDDI